MLANKRMRKHIDLVATCGLALVLAALTMSAWLADENTRQLERNEQWVKHIYDVLAALDGLLATLLDAETGQRGFCSRGNLASCNPTGKRLCAWAKW